MKVLALGTMLFSMFIFTSCSSMSESSKNHNCCKKHSETCKDGCKKDKSCCDDKCGQCDGKDSCSKGECENSKAKSA